MKYGQPYVEYKLTSEELDLVESAIKDPKFEDGVAFSQRSIRKSRIAWIDDPGLDIILLRMGRRISQESGWNVSCLLYTSPSPRDLSTSRMPSSA